MVHKKGTKLNMWKKEEKLFIKNNYKNKTTKELSIALKRSKKSIMGKIERMNLKKIDNLWKKEELILLKEKQNLTTPKLMKFLPNRTHLSIEHKRKRCGLERNIPFWKTNNTGYVYRIDNKKIIFEHREIIERHLGRKLNKNERIHHIDGNKNNNKIDNLAICNNDKHHRLLHANLEKVAYVLVRNGVIKFNKISGEYYI